MPKRTYEDLSQTEFAAITSDQGGVYERAEQLYAQIDDGLAVPLDDASIHVLGFEFEVDPPSGDYPYADLQDTLVLGAVWLVHESPTEADLYLAALEDEGDTSGFPSSSDGDGTFFVARYTGDAGEISPEFWRESVQSVPGESNQTRGLLGTAFRFRAHSTPFTVYLASAGQDSWYGVGATLSTGSDGTVAYSDGWYRYLEWLFADLGLLDSDENDGPTPPFGGASDWMAYQPRSGSFELDASAMGTMPQRYGDGPLWYDIDGREADVSQLQADLWKVGFWFTGMGDNFTTPFDPSGDLPELATADATGDFDVETAWAVREFQIYAGMDTVAEVNDGSANVYADTLAPVANPDTYEGDVTGLFDWRTAELLETWVDDQLRCPVVMEGRSGANKQTVEGQNFHAGIYDAYDSSTDRIYAMDLTDQYPLPDENRRELENDTVHGRYVVGDYQTYIRWAGPRSKPSIHVWPEGELVPWQFLRDFAEGDNLDANQEPTYKVVRAVGHVECYGYADSVNSYDNAIASVGPSHWTFTIIPSDASNEPNDDEAMPEGELPPVLAHFAESEPDEFESLFRRFGLETNQDWNQDGSDVWVGQRKYKDTLQMRYPQTDGAEPETALQEIRFRDLEYFASWHWFYRYEMAGRTNDAYRQNMWDMARVRIRDLLETEFDDSDEDGDGTRDPAVPDVTLDDGSTRTARVGDVFTSEQAIALLMRWHVRYPGNVAGSHVAGSYLEDVYEKAKDEATANLDQDPTNWPETDAVGQTIVDAILEEVDGAVDTSNATHNVHHDDEGNFEYEEWEGDDLYVWDNGSRRWQWKGVAANKYNRSFLVSLTKVLEWPDRAVSSDENHTDYTTTLYEDLGELDTSRGSFSFEDANLPDAPYDTELDL